MAEVKAAVAELVAKYDEASPYRSAAGVVADPALPKDIVMLVGHDTEFEILDGGFVKYTGTPPQFAHVASVDPDWNPDLSFLPPPPPEPRRLTSKDAAFLREPASNEGRVAFYANLVVQRPVSNMRIKLT